MANLVSELFSKNLLLTCVALVRYIPRAFHVPRVEGMAFFTERKRTEYLNRVASLKPDSSRCWGTMTVDQDVHHLNLACGGGLGFYELPDESYLTSRTVFRWIFVDLLNEQPRGLRLPKDFKIPPDQHFDFYPEQEKLRKIIDVASRTTADEDWKPHPLFGKMSAREWGKLLQMHIDYHLRQFGA